MVASGGVLSEGYGHGGPGVCLGRINYLRGNSTHLLIGFNTPQGTQSRGVIRRWFRQILTESAVNVTIYRSNSTSAGVSNGLPVRFLLRYDVGAMQKHLRYFTINLYMKKTSKLYNVLVSYCLAVIQKLPNLMCFLLAQIVR